MVIDMSYWTKVLRRLVIFVATILGIYLAFKLATFYMPFLIAFIISLLIEPLIKKVNKKTKIGRKRSAILVIIIVSLLIIGLLVWGIVSILSEASNLLGSLNFYFDKAYNQVQSIIASFDFDKIHLSEEVITVLRNSAQEFLGFLTQKAKDVLTGTIGFLTSLPAIGIFLGITLLATYFMCADRLYILDQVEHHFPKSWIKKVTVHLKEIISSLGSYLKAEVILVLISFIQVLIGLFLMKLFGLNIQYPVIAAIAIGFVDALPILGSGTVIVPWSIISAINGDIKLAIALIVLFIIISVVRQLIEPKIVSKQIGIHPIFTLIAMYTGFKAIGVFGLLIGPIVLIIFKNVFSTLIDRGVIKTIFDRK